MKTILATLVLTLPTLAFAVDLEGYYITPKVGVSKSMDTGKTNYWEDGGKNLFEDEDLGTGYAAGLSAGKYITNNFRVELEAMKRGSYEYDTFLTGSTTAQLKADITSRSLFINGLYDFDAFSLGNRSISPYIGGGVGISRNGMGRMGAYISGVSEDAVESKTITEFAYKLSAGILVNLTESVSLDINYQYVNLGNFKSGTVYGRGSFDTPIKGEIESQELMVGLQYKFN